MSNTSIEVLESPSRSSTERIIFQKYSIWRHVAYPILGIAASGSVIHKMWNPTNEIKPLPFKSFKKIVSGKYLQSNFRNVLRFIGLPTAFFVFGMEIWGENAILAEKLPVGYYKFRFSSYTPTKLVISHDEVKKYWQDHPVEFDWRFNHRAMLTLDDFKNGKRVDDNSYRPYLSQLDSKEEDPRWNEILQKFNNPMHK